MRKIKKLFYVCLCIVYVPFAYIGAILTKIFIHDLWLVSECGSYARDNGYWFFKYLKEKHPEQKVIFVIDKKSPDYEKVNSIGKTCGFRTFSHWFFYFLCKKEISSHPHFKPGFYINKNLWQNKTYFLQHGVIRDFTGYISKNIKLKLFVTSAYEEDAFIKANYGFDSNIVKLCGLARHDNLVKNAVNEKQILIMPTWRQYLIGLNKKSFENSNYFLSWSQLLNSKQLLDLLEKNDKYIIFYPHREMQKFIECFKSDNPRIIIADIKHFDVQTLLKESSLLITDYSSVFFDFAYMKKPVLWYFFDDEEYRKSHHSKGYFNTDDNRLGISCYNQNELINNINCYVLNGFELNTKQINDVNAFYAYFDGKNCERIYNIIKGIK